MALKLADELNELTGLHVSGKLSDEQFLTAKQELLNKWKAQNGKPQRKSNARLLLAILLLLVLAAPILDVFTRDESRITNQSQNIVRAEQVKRAWYEGGTLHKSTLKEWHLASYDDRLATSADFVAAHMHRAGKTIPPINYIRPYAEGLERGISKAANDPTASSLAVSEVAASIFVLGEQ